NSKSLKTYEIKCTMGGCICGDLGSVFDLRCEQQGGNQQGGLRGYCDDERFRCGTAGRGGSTRERSRLEAVLQRGGPDTDRRQQKGGGSEEFLPERRRRGFGVLRGERNRPEKRFGHPGLFGKRGVA